MRTLNGGPGAAENGHGADGAPESVRMRVAFVHPELGIGGAERLILDAAATLHEVGHDVTLFTTRHDAHRALALTRGAHIPIRVYGRHLPTHLLHRLRAPAAIARMHYLAACVAAQPRPYDVLVCDLVAHVVPFLRALTRTRVAYYCHYPDRFLAPSGSGLYAAYRRPIDALEVFGLRAADAILVNSRFTEAALRRAVPDLPTEAAQVVYPGVDCSLYDTPVPSALPMRLRERLQSRPNKASASMAVEAGAPVLLCLSRYDSGKNLELALDALHVLTRERLTSPPVLVVAGGYDPQVRDNEATLQRLVERARALDLVASVVFLRSITDEERRWLLARCRCVVYTPVLEHFGLVPLEAMAARRPVVAVNGGGVRETVVHDQTGFLCPPGPAEFARAIRRLLEDPECAKHMGEQGRERVEATFSRSIFGRRFDQVLQAVVRGRLGGDPGDPVAASGAWSA